MALTRELKFKILNALSELPTRRSSGICDQIEDALIDFNSDNFNDTCDEAETALNWARAAMKRWPHRSIDEDYPVHVSDDIPARIEFELAYKAGVMWDENTEYGRARYALLAFLIHEMLKEL